MLSSNLLAAFLTLLAALAWLRLNDFAAHRGWISSSLSRKIIHSGTGPIFVACWLLYNNTASARYLAALIPLAITAQFILVGTGMIKDPAAVQAMSRSGDRREILRGPLYYGLIFVLLTIFYWYDTPIGIIALMLMCGGDGLADIVGRRFGTAKLPWNRSKSWIGSAGMFFGGWLTSLAILALYVAAGIFTPPLSSYLLPLTLIALAGTVVESLPLQDVDNITITLAALATGHLLLA
jgi:phytol kinase